jgi:hypothetical protein
MADKYSQEFGRNVNGYLRDYIKYADTKAGILLLIEAGLLYKVTESWRWILKLNTQAVDISAFQIFLMALTTLSLLVSLFIALGVIFPRLGEKGKKKGYIFWLDVAKFPSAETYAKEVLDLPEKELDTILSEQNYYLSVTAKRKYQWLQWAFYLGIPSIFVNIVVLGFIAVEKT